MKRSRVAVTLSLLAAASIAVPVAAVAPPPLSAAASNHAVYENALDLRMPDGSQAASCADPDIIRGQAEGDTNWYLYCTTDVLTEGEVDGAGNPVFHSIPMFVSSDLALWVYAGDAFPSKPEWVPPSGGIWAPEITYLNGQYMLFFGAPDTLIGGGSSAIGVATSDSPLGPWVDSGGPVVAPAEDGRWQFDPEVIEADGTLYLYFGSYFGGIFARQLSPDGLISIPETETRITIDNRYEGSVIVQRDGWYYLLASATNCCNGPLTGYAVFAGRSQSPLGPFVDRDGVSLLASRVGGTPVLVQNGNRWVGPGHNTVFTDFGGQMWTIYHAVDQGDPYYAGDVGYTKRPALMDPLDWKDGWPVVRGGYGPSDEPMPLPGAQPGQASAYVPQFEPQIKKGRTFAKLSDQFGGKRLSRQWSWVRPDAASATLSRGQLVWATQAADIHPPAEPLASVLTEPTPRGDYMVETKVTMSTPAEGCCQNYVQGGIMIYGDDGRYVKLVSVSIWNTRQTEFGKQDSSLPEGYPSYGNTVVGPVGESSYLRIVHREVGGVHHYTPYTSLNGKTWVEGGTWTHDLGAQPRIGLVSMGGEGFTSSFDYVKVSAIR